MAGEQEYALAAHRRLLDGDPTASADLADLLLEPLVKRLHRRWPDRRYEEATHDAATEVFMQYVEKPDRYDPTKKSLVSWLEMQAHADLINDYRSPTKEFERSWTVESDLVGEHDAPVPLSDLVPTEDVHPADVNDGMLARVRDAFPDERDRRLINLLIEGDRSTESAAKVLGIVDLAPEEQARVVKQNKDRVMKRLRRMGLS